MSNRAKQTKASALQKRAAQRRTAKPASSRRLLVGGVVGGVVAVAVIVTVAIVALSGGGKSTPPNPEAVKYGCVSCHTSGGGRSEGPTWKGLAGSTVTLTDGRTVIADDAYLRQSITSPQADIVAGFTTSLMPKLSIPPADVERLIAYIKSLKG